MKRIAVTALALFLLVSCGGGPKPIGKGTDLYILNSTLVDPAHNTVTLIISVDSQSSQADVKAVAEMVVAKHKNDYPNITIKTYRMGSDMSELPFATSLYADGSVTHFFNKMVTPEKIPTH